MEQQTNAAWSNMKQAAPFTSPAAVDIKKARKIMPAAGGGRGGGGGNVKTCSLKDHTTNSSRSCLLLAWYSHNPEYEYSSSNSNIA